MKGFSFLACLLVLAARGAAAPGAAEVNNAFRRIAAAPLWPGFQPGKTPLAIYDGTQTWLFDHPGPPPEFAAAPEGSPARVMPGQHDAVRANSSAQIGGVVVATMMVSADEHRSAEELASIAVHEAFHVYQRGAPKVWNADEGALMTYPITDPQLLMMRRCETEALRRALAEGGGADAAGWVAEALAWRSQRFGRVGDAAGACERGLELREGLAQYVERKSLGRLDATRLPRAPDEYPAEALRNRCYDIGQALGVLLDRFRPGWPAELDAAAAGGAPALDQMLRESISAAGAPTRPLPPEVLREIGTRAERDAAALTATLASTRDAYLARPGWTIRVIAGSEPLWPQGFDPMNLTVLGGGELLHTRWLRLGNKGGSVEVLGRAALTLPAGDHPLFNGVREVLITGIPDEPKIGENTAIFDAEGLHVRFDRVAIERDGTRITIRPAPS